MTHPNKLDATGVLGTATSGELRLSGGAANLNIAGANMPGQLYQAHFDGLIPKLSDEDGLVAVHYQRRPHPFANDRGEGTIKLSADVPWSLRVHDAAAYLTANLSDLTLTDLTFDSALADATLELPRPVGEVAIRIDGPVRNLRLRRPIGVPIGVRIAGGANRIDIDGEELGAIGGGYRNTAPTSTDHYTLVITKAADGLTVAH